MAKPLVVIDQGYLKHLPGESHPERPERIQALLNLAGALDKQMFELASPRAATRADVEYTHGADHVRLVESTSKHNRYALDGDTITCRDSFGVALLAVGGFLALLDAIASKQSSERFCSGAAARPSRFARARDGFLLVQHHRDRRRIFKARPRRKKDFDHGLGRASRQRHSGRFLRRSYGDFYFHASISVLSRQRRSQRNRRPRGRRLHAQRPASGRLRRCRNICKSSKISSFPPPEKFQPDWILVSAGFDPHRRDPLGGMDVTEEGFGAMARLLLALANRFADGRIAFLLEGGYDLAGLRDSVAAVLAAMQAQVPPPAGHLPLAESRIEPVIRRILQVHEKYQ